MCKLGTAFHKIGFLSDGTAVGKTDEGVIAPCLDMGLSVSVLACLKGSGPAQAAVAEALVGQTRSSPGRILSPLLSPAAALELDSVTVPALCRWVLQDAFPSIQLMCTAARLACLMPTGEGN